MHNIEFAQRNIAIAKIVIPSLDLRGMIDDDMTPRRAEEIEEDPEERKGIAVTTREFNGPLMPVILRTTNRNGVYELVAGKRRFIAAKSEGITKIPARIADGIDNKTMLIMMLIENIQRKNYKALEEALGMQMLRDEHGLSEDAIAEYLGMDPRFIEDRLLLLDLPGPVKQLIHEGKLGVSHALKITKLDGKKDKQIAIASQAAEHKMSVEVVEKVVQEATRRKKPRKKVKRKHWVKKTGEKLSDSQANKMLQQVVIRGEALSNACDAVPYNRLGDAQLEQYVAALRAVNAETDKKLRKAVNALKRRLKK